MKDGFYCVRSAEPGEDPAEEEAYGVAILAHLKNGRFVGVDAGGCRVSGTYEVTADGRMAVRLAYAFRAGVELPNGVVISEPTTVNTDLVLGEAAVDGAPVLVDIGLGPRYIRLEWLAEPA